MFQIRLLVLAMINTQVFKQVFGLKMIRFLCKDADKTGVINQQITTSYG